MSRDELFQQALALPADDRELLADLLEQSLPIAQMPPDVAAAWTAEIDRRIEAYERGEAHAVDARTAMEELRRQLAEIRRVRAS